jgi:peroxiredoxin
MSETPPTRLLPGDTAPALRLPAIDDGTFDLASLSGRRHLLAFFRFASCPFCNLRVHELVQRFGELGPGFAVVAVFDSPLDNLQRHAERHTAPFPILADETGDAYRAYAIERSVGGMLKGMALRAPTLIKAMSRGYLPTTLKGSLTTMPADFLIDEAGVIRTARYGSDEGDHLPFEAVLAFSQVGEVTP